MTRFSDAQLDELRGRHPCDEVAAKWVALRKKGNKMIGPCPIHSPDPNARDSTSFECDAEGWVCASCADGGDVIKLVQKREGLDFLAAVAWLGGTRALDPEEEKRAEAARARRQAERERENTQWREKARGWAWDRWAPGRDFAGSLGAECFLRRLGGAAPLPQPRALRFDPAARYYVEDRDDDGKKIFRLIHTGPAWLAAIERDGKFLGLHRTFIDPDRPPKFKAAITDPKTGEALNAKTMHGGKRGGHIALYGAGAAQQDGPETLILGEGIEKVAAVWTALSEGGRDVTRAAAWVAGDLGNLGGKAKATVPHPTLKGPGGRPLRPPGPEPDMDAPAIRVPDSVTRLVLLGDSTSDRFTTECVLARAAARYAKPGREVVVAWGPERMDFDDVLREASAEAHRAKAEGGKVTE